MGKIKFDGRGRGANGFIVCYLISSLLIILWSFIFALIVGRFKNPTQYIDLFSLITLSVSAASGGICCKIINKDSYIRFSLLAALALVLTMLLINVIISSGRVSGSAFMNYGCFFGIFVAFSLVRLPKGKRKKRRRQSK